MKKKLAEEINEIIAITKDDESYLSSKIEQLIEERKAKEAIPNRTSDIYSVFKFFNLDDKIPFSRYSYGNHQSQKMRNLR